MPHLEMKTGVFLFRWDTLEAKKRLVNGNVRRMPVAGDNAPEEIDVQRFKAGRDATRPQESKRRKLDRVVDGAQKRWS